MMRVMTEFESEEYVRTCCNVCLYHHERYEGNGFPAGLKKDRIPLEAQLVGLADMYDVLIHSDMGRKAVTKGQAYMMLMNGECGELSPRMKECLEDAREDLEAFKL